MAVSPSSGSNSDGNTSGSGPAPAAPAPAPAPAGSGPSSSALGPVDTHVIDVAADRYHQVGEQIKMLAARAADLARYSPTFSGAPDSYWNSFITQGYGDAAQGTSDALRGAAQAVSALADTSKQLSTLFTRTEQQNVDVAGQLARAVDRGHDPVSPRDEVSSLRGAEPEVPVSDSMSRRDEVSSLPGAQPVEPDVVEDQEPRRRLVAGGAEATSGSDGS